MAIAVTKEKVALFEAMFKAPSLEAMHQLEPTDFERFIAYVFTCAGYTVEHVASDRLPFGPGVDLNLYASPGAKKPLARVEVKRWAPGHRVGLDDITAFNGVLNYGEAVPGYFVTTSDFHLNARHFAEHTHNMLRLLNGELLLRYITYVRGSRVSDPTGLQRTPTLTPPDWLCDPTGQVHHCNPTRTTVLTIANNKGGVAKTTTALNLGLALAGRGERVLLVDLDGQASLTAALPLPDSRPRPPRNAPLPERERFITTYFTRQTPQLRDLAQKTRFDNVYLLPANEELHRLDTGGAARIQDELVFVRDLHSPALTTPHEDGGEQAFDWIILDTPPAQSHFTRLALAAAHYVVIPIQVEAFGTYGINRALATAETMRALMGEGVQVVGCLRTRWRSNATSRNALAKLKNDLLVRNVPLFESEIPVEDKIEQAHQTTIGGGVRSLFGFATNAASTGYQAALDELIRKVQPHVHQPR